MESKEDLKKKILRLQMIGWTFEDIERFTNLKASEIRKLLNSSINES